MLPQAFNLQGKRHGKVQKECTTRTGLVAPMKMGRILDLERVLGFPIDKHQEAVF